MSVAQILGYVTGLLNDWGIMPFVQALLLLMTVLSAIVFVRRLGQGS